MVSNNCQGFQGFTEPLFVELVLLDHEQNVPGSFLGVGPAIPAVPDMHTPYHAIENERRALHCLGGTPGMAKPFYRGRNVAYCLMDPTPPVIEILKLFTAPYPLRLDETMHLL